MLVESEARLTKLHKLKQARRLAPQLAEASTRLQGRMHAVMRTTCAEFDDAAYGAAVQVDDSNSNPKLCNRNLNHNTCPVRGPSPRPTNA